MSTTLTRAELERAIIDVAITWARADREYAAAVATHGHATPELEAASRMIDEADKRFYDVARDLLAAVERDTP